MNKELKSIGAFIIASAIIWAVVIIGSSLELEGTGCYDRIQNILAGGVILHLILIWGPIIVISRKRKTKSDERDENE